jgi:hypothetical protein
VQQKEEKPKPIFVAKVNDYFKLLRFLQQSNADDSFTCQQMAGEQVKVQPASIETFRTITGMLRNSSEYEWHTYFLNNEKPIKMVIKGIPSSIQPDVIKNALCEQGLKVLRVVNLWKTVKSEGKKKSESKKSRVPTPLFMVDFASDSDISAIKAISSVLHLKVSIEAWRKPKGVPQCKNCQAYGHTRNRCFRKPKCVKCGGEHDSKGCEKTKDQPCKCALCGEAHPASYKGCVVAVAMRTRTRSITGNVTQRKGIRKAGITYAAATTTRKSEIRRGTEEEAGAGPAESQHQATEVATQIQVDTSGDKLNIILNKLSKMEKTLEKVDALEKKIKKLEGILETKKR